MTIKKQKEKYITQLDYIKILLEEDRLGEALNYTNILSTGLQQDCELLAETFNRTRVLNITKEQSKTKNGNWIFLRDSWFKLLDKDKSMIHLEVCKNIEIKIPYNVINENQPSTSK